MRPRDKSKFNLAVKISSRSSGGDTGHMIVRTSFMLFGCANPASQAGVRLQLLYDPLSVGKHTGHATTMSLDHINSTDDNEANSSRSPVQALMTMRQTAAGVQFTANRKVACAAKSRCWKVQGREGRGGAGRGGAGQGRAGQGRAGQGRNALTIVQ